MADLIAQRDRKLGNFVSAPALAEYAPRYREHFVLDREGGVLTVRMHTDGGSAQWSRGLLNAWNQMLRDVGADRHNEVIIFTGTGQHWIGGVQPSSFAQPMSRWPSDMVDEQLTDGIKALERLVLDVDVPTIAAVNGPGPRQELGLLCDITICADTTTFADGNFTAGSVPGDGPQTGRSPRVYRRHPVRRAGVGSGPGERGPSRREGAAESTGDRVQHHGQAAGVSPADPRPDRANLAAASDRRSAQRLHPPAVRHDSQLKPVTVAVGTPASVPPDNGASIEARGPSASGAIIAATEAPFREPPPHTPHPHRRPGVTWTCAFPVDPPG